MPQVQQIDDLTENTLLSGFVGKPTPGLLEKLGTTRRDGDKFTTTGDGIFLIKDFTTVLSMRREKQAMILAQLREIHDGEFKRDFGTGQSKIWNGRVSIIAAVTPAIDRQYSIFSTLGERFLQVRWSRPDSEVAGEWAINQQGKESQIRARAQRIITDAFENATKVPPQLSPEKATRLASLAEIAAIGRTHVGRDNSREIEYVPEPEANTRIAKGLAAIAKGLGSLYGRSVVSEQDLQDATCVGLDCMSSARRAAFDAIALGRDVDQIKLSRTVRHRQLEELVALGLLTKREGANSYSLSDKCRRLLDKAAPEYFTRSVPKCSGGTK